MFPLKKVDGTVSSGELDGGHMNMLKMQLMHGFIWTDLCSLLQCLPHEHVRFHSSTKLRIASNTVITCNLGCSCRNWIDGIVIIAVGYIFYYSMFSKYPQEGYSCSTGQGSFLLNKKNKTVKC